MKIRPIMTIATAPMDSHVGSDAEALPSIRLGQQSVGGHSLLAGSDSDESNDAPKRVRLLGAVSAAWFMAAMLLDLALDATGVRPAAPHLMTILSTMTALAGGLWFIGGTRISPALGRRLGVAFVLLISAVVAFYTKALAPTDVAPANGWTQVTVWTLFSVLILDLGPRRSLIVATVSVLIEPLAVVILGSFFQAGPPLEGMLVAHASTLLITPMLVWVVSHWNQRIAARLHAAREMGRYALKDLLGRGGMGEVWRATHRMLRQDVAVKVIRSEKMGRGEQAKTLRKRFVLEARATAALQSPHTISVLDFGETRRGEFYYAMELLDGIDLATLIQRFGPQPADRAAYIMLQALRSLSEAHAAGLVHRDIKPANIFICRYAGEVDWVKVLDFGMVKHSGPGGDGDGSRLTMDGSVSGTPAYMAPEQVLGDSLDGRADLYALACTMFNVLTGRDVFEDASLTRILFAHVDKTADRPSVHAELPVPEAFEGLLMECLHKKPDQRPASAATLAAAISATGVADSWTAERADRWWSEQLPVATRPGAAVAAPPVGPSSPLRNTAPRGLVNSANGAPAGGFDETVTAGGLKEAVDEAIGEAVSETGSAQRGTRDERPPRDTPQPSETIERD